MFVNGWIEPVPPLNCSWAFDGEQWAGNYVHDNGDAGLAMLEAFGAQVFDNVFKNNTYGIRLSVGSAHNVFHRNEVIDSIK